MANLRFQALNAVLSRTIPEVKTPSSKISEFFGVNVFDKKKMKEFLSKEAYQSIINSIELGTSVNREVSEQIAAAMKAQDDIDLVLEGHTDSRGADQYNMSLSDRRAKAVKAKLGEDYGIPAARISAVGYGETQPIATNETDEGRARNRRFGGDSVDRCHLRLVTWGGSLAFHSRP